MEKETDEILEDFRIHLFESGRVSSQMTIESYLGNIRQLLEWMQEEDVELENLDRMGMLNYLKHLEKLNYKPTTYNTKTNSLISFSNFLISKSINRREMIFIKDKIGLSSNRNIEIYTEEEIDLIKDYLANETLSERDRLIIKMLMELGVRVSELTNLTLDNIDILGQQIDIYGKGSKIRTLPIKRDLADDIRNYISSSRKDNKHATSKYLFVSERSPKLHRNTILEVVKQMGEDLRIENCYCHKFRHTLATRMSKNVQIQVIQKFLGHADIKTTIDYYVNVDKKELEKALESI